MVCSATSSVENELFQFGIDGLFYTLFKQPVLPVQNVDTAVFERLPLMF